MDDMDDMDQMVELGITNQLFSPASASQPLA
jgi:hypothetical protein